MIQKTNSKHNQKQAANEQADNPHEELQDYGGHIKARHGKINGWLLIVYIVLFIWALYYAYIYWGGLGPGLDY